MSDYKTEFSQGIATGDHAEGDHAKNVEAEAVKHGVGNVLASQPGLDTQTGPIGPTPEIK